MGEEFHMKFVKPRNGDLDPRLVEASSMLKEHGLSPEWIDQDQCLSVDSAGKNHIYVMEPFEGPGFDHLKLLGCRLFGPQCILASLNFKMELPQKKRPIYSMCMKGVVICCTNMDKKTRDQVHDLVKLMAGEAICHLTDDVTHLVAGEVGSQKYTVAASRGTPIMSMEWVKEAWQMAQHRYVDCMESGFLHKYRCPIFRGLVVTVSGLTQDERHKVKQLVETEGGTYTGEMKMNECTHLILKEPKGQKYDYAMKWSIHIVNLSWVYDSLDKNYCQEEKNYPVTGKPGVYRVKTSTPEKSRLSTINPSISDISAISTAHVDETAMTRTRLSEVTLDNFEQLDVSQAGSECVLSSCRVFLSVGLQGALLDKCRRITNTMGATRMTDLSDSVTHFVMEEKVDAEVEALNNMELRPHIVSAMWLAECFRRSCHVSEAAYLCPHFVVSDIELPKLPLAKRASVTKNKKDGENEDQAEETVLPNAAVPSNTSQGKVEEDHLLSQYLDDGSRTVLQPMDEVDGNASSTRVKATTEGQGQDTTEDLECEDNDDATQDPEGEVSTAGGVFGGKSFMFFGFCEEDVTALSDMVTQAGGVCVRGRRRVPGYGVVPVLGFPVEQSVGQVVTNAWLQMCIEAEEMLPVHSNPIFQPVDINESSRPLQGCVLSVSGYKGAERDCLHHIADILGAVCQEFFVRKAKKSLKASTHLIVKEPSGPKYTAAKSWNIPALTKHWLFACAKSGQRESEDQFHIDNMDSNDVTMAAASEEGGQETAGALTRGSSTDRSEESGKETSGNDGSDTAPQPSPRPQHPHPAAGRREGEEGAGQVLTDRGTEHPSSADSATPNRETVPTSSASDREQGEVRCHDLSNPMGSAKAMVEQQGRRSQSQKENMSAAVNMGLPAKLSTPGTERKHSRVEELQEQNRKPLWSPGLESPSVFLAPGYRPKFDLTGVFEYLKSPDVPPKQQESPSLEELIKFHLSEGVKNSSKPRTSDPEPSSSQSSQVEDRGPLEGVVIAVSKKLGLNQTEYNSIVVELGGDYTWQYSPSCTHFIFQGRANDLNKEYRQAKSQGKIVVSPHWLYACMEQRSRVDEAMYPHNYNPNLNLGGVVRTETPSRGLRRSVRTTPRSAHDGSAKHTPAQPAAKSQASAKCVSEAWQESMTEMKKWQGGTAGATTPAAKVKKMGSVVEEGSPQMRQTTEVTEVADRESMGETSAENKTRGSSLSSSSDEKSGADGSKGKAGENGEEASLKEKESEHKEATTPMEDGGSLEIRQALSKTLETVKASSSRSKKSRKKRNRRAAEGNSSGDQINTSGNLSESATTHHASPWQTQHKAQEGLHTGESLGTEASQSVQITWDDPTGRREKERLAHKLEMDCGPSQNTEDFMANMDMPDLDHPSLLAQPEEKSVRQPAMEVRSPTPEAPPLAFPTARLLSRVTSPQPIELLSEESSESQAQASPRKPIILTSGMATPERIEFSAVIERLGGTVLEKSQFDPQCTHVVVAKPSRNEKFLAAVATGRWVLHKSYLIACRQEGRFVREEDHEWGNPAMSHLMQTLDSQSYSLGTSAHKWRHKLQALKKTKGGDQGAYQGWQVILLTEPKREDNFRRLLSAGGATVLNLRPPFTEVEATHCFVEMHKVKLSESDLQALVTGVTHILKPEFIAAHLTDDPPPDPHNFTPPEVVRIRSRLSEDGARKRKGGAVAVGESSKRSRR
ncbi:DNA topoisomerase 2-binding protein 1-A-like [Babylonia areolata]|uniref:DNA topoisomerase 2-binding protein 1-A-like n=1 Tax=Babylonia areolata TaxID=304850 RepID=UPI003FCF7995